MWSDPDAWNLLMSKIAEVVRRYLRAQIEAGAQAVQLFDSWVGALSPGDYEEHVQPHVRHILKDVETMGVPVIHFGTGTSALLELQRDAGGTVIGVDHRVRLAEAWKRIGHDRAIQGNLDPLLLWRRVRSRCGARSRSCARRAGGRGTSPRAERGCAPSIPPCGFATAPFATA
jgi:uroporphyrinogen decarboxylase